MSNPTYSIVRPTIGTTICEADTYDGALDYAQAEARERNIKLIVVSPDSIRLATVHPGGEVVYG